MSGHATLKAFVAAGGMGPVPPTIAEVAKALGVSESTARNRLESAVEDGLLQKSQGQARGYRLSAAGERVVMSL